MKGKRKSIPNPLRTVLHIITAFFLILSFLCLLVCFIWFPGAYTSATAALENAQEELVHGSLPQNICSGIQQYSNIIVGVLVSISVALISITATIFIFSKSALDRINDENEYVSDIVNIHKFYNIKDLFKICFFTITQIIITLAWHLLFSFWAIQSPILVGTGFTFLIASIIVYVILSGIFWRQCIRVEKSLQKIIISECANLKTELNHTLPKQNSAERYRVIGDWVTWEEDSTSTFYVSSGRDLCQKMTPDQFISFFQKTEKLLLSGDISAETPSSIITILQERKDVLSPNIAVEKDDLADRTYIGSAQNIFNAIEDFEININYQVSQEETFYSDTKKIYDYLKAYRNLLVSVRYTCSMVDDKTNTKRKTHSDYPENESSLIIFAEALYYFFLRLLAIFVSSVKIKNFSLNGCSLNYANFYGSSLENITLYSSILYRTILSRATLSGVIMDISKLCEIDFYSTEMHNSALNNSILENVCFERSSMTHIGFDSCSFTTCAFKDTVISHGNFNNTEFSNSNFISSDFSSGKFKNVQWDNCQIEDCSFQDCDIQSWKGNPDFSMLNCDFTRSTWREMESEQWNLDGSVFIEADLTAIKFKNVKLSSASFLHCCLADSHLSDCDMKRSSLQHASLFQARLDDVNLSTADLSNVIAVKARFRNCALDHTNCADADFSEAIFDKVDFSAARLYDCAMTTINIKNSNCNYILADHVQFTFSKCVNCNFKYGSFADSNMTKTHFISCDFSGSDLSGLNATETKFCNCKVVGVDFSGSRFCQAQFKGNMIFKNCIFSSCQFESVQFDNVCFVDCIFSDSVFTHCTVIRSLPQPLSKNNFKLLSNTACSSIKWL